MNRLVKKITTLLLFCTVVAFPPSIEAAQSTDANPDEKNIKNHTEIKKLINSLYGHLGENEKKEALKEAITGDNGAISKKKTDDEKPDDKKKKEIDRKKGFFNNLIADLLKEQNQDYKNLKRTFTDETSSSFAQGFYKVTGINPMTSDYEDQDLGTLLEELLGYLNTKNEKKEKLKKEIDNKQLQLIKTTTDNGNKKSISIESILGIFGSNANKSNQKMIGGFLFICFLALLAYYVVTSNNKVKAKMKTKKKKKKKSEEKEVKTEF